MKFSAIAAVVGGAALAAAAPTSHLDKRYQEMIDGKNHTVFEHAATGAKMSFVTNSGICETTPGVNQYSGYLSVGSNMNMFFWFFESRNNPTTAPLATWLNGGPGCSSMIGLFQENGPCHFANANDNEPSLNPNSWNSYANMLYVDQPIGTGFSYGDDQAVSTLTAAPYVWTLLQAFYANFPQYENRDYGLFTESYGGHYGPEFAYYFEQQNNKIDSGTISGTKIPLVALGINNGWYDPKIQYKAFIDYALNNKYNQIIDQNQADQYVSIYNNKCVPALNQCTAATGQNNACSNAENVCYSYIEGDISQQSDFDVYDVREPSQDPYPPGNYESYLSRSDIQSAIGAKTQFSMCANDPYSKMSSTGDNSRSFLATLGQVVQSGITVALVAGDADYICNYVGGFGVANALSWSQSSTFKSKALTSYTVNGSAKGLFKTVGNLSWLQVYGAGHEVPYYQPEAGLQYFIQTMSKKPLSST